MPMAKPHLFEPITLRGTEFKNRLWVSPMCQYQATDGLANNWHLVHYGSFARGGAGLVIVESTGVSPAGRISPNCLGLWNDEQMEALKKVTAIAHEADAKIGIQLNHAGRKASLHAMLPGIPDGSQTAEQGGWETVSASGEAFTGYAQPRYLETAEVKQIIQDFIDATDRAVEAGFDVVELHAAHGYLLFEFLSPLSNKRDDEYGGDFEGRTRMIRETVRGMRARHPELPIMIRISASEWFEGGFEPADGAKLAKILKEEGVDFIDVSSGGNIAEQRITVGPSYQTKFAHKVREGGLPVSAVGMILAPEQAEAILVTGMADVVQIGREALRNPNTPILWAKALRSDRIQDFVPGSYFKAWPSR